MADGVDAVAFDVNETMFRSTGWVQPSPVWDWMPDWCRCGSSGCCATGSR
jgi:hypothetical protein